MPDHTPPTDQELDDIEARANAATPGPWRRPLNTRYKHTVTAPLPDDERGSYLDGIDPVTGEREQCTVATIPIWSNGRHSRQRGGRDLEYIAAMHPEVAKTLVAEVRRLRAQVADLGAENAKLIRWHGEDAKALNRMRDTIVRLRVELAETAARVPAVVETGEAGA